MSDAATAGHEQEHEDPGYMRILLALAVLTVVEVGATFLTQVGVPRALINVSLVLMSSAKIVLIAGFFMHLRWDSNRLLLVVASPVLMSICLFVIPLLEAVTK